MVDIDKDYSVYIHTFPNGKRYVGLTKQNPEVRWGTNGSGYKEQPVYEAIQEFGWDNIKHDIIATNLSRDEAQALEIEMISKYDTINIGYNVSAGGGCGGNSWIQFEYDGDVYSPDDLARLSSLDNLTGHDLTTRINHHGWSLERAMSQPKIPKNIVYYYGNQSGTAKDWYERRIDQNLTYDQIRDRLGKGWDVMRAITQPNTVKDQPSGVGDRIYEYNGKMYNTYELCQISPIKGLKPIDITTRVNHHGWSVHDAITKPKRHRGIMFEYEGDTYTSHELASICIDKTMTYHDVTDRNRLGWTPWEIVNIPKGTTRSQYYRKHANQKVSL